MVNGGERHRNCGIGGVRNPDDTMSGEDDNARLQERERGNFIALEVDRGEN